MDDKEATSTPGAEPAPPEAPFVTGATSGPSIRELEDSSLLSGLFGNDSFAAIRDSLRQEWESRGAELDRQVVADEKTWAAYGDDLRGERKALEEEAAELERARREVEEELAEVLRQERTLAGLTSRLAAHLRIRRSGYPLRFLDRLQERLIATERQHLEVARERHALAQEVRELNQEEHDRRVKRLDAQRSEGEEQLTRLRKKLDVLRHIGIHRTSAGFLAWAGYLAFPAVGWFLGERLRRLDEGDSGFQALVQLLARTFTALYSHLGLWTIGLLIGLPLVLVILFYGLLVVSDKVVGRFDPRWGKNRSEHARNDWLPRPHEQVNRGDYGRIVARLPLLVVGLLLPIGLAVAIAIGGSQDAQLAGLAAEPWGTVLYTFLGIVMVIGATGITLLYTSQVTERRVEAAVAVGRPLSPFRLHAELVTLVSAAIVLTAVSSLPRLPWGFEAPALDSPLPLLLALLAIGLVTSYGLVYKGLFRDERALQRQRDEIDQVIESYSAFPLVPQQDGEIRQYLQMLTRLRQTIEAHWDASEGAEPRRWTRRLRAWMRWSGAGSLPYGPLDVLFEPEMVERIEEVDSAAAVLSPRSDLARERLQRLAERHRQASERLVVVRGELQKLPVQSEQRRRNALQAKFSMSRFYSNALSRCAAAHAAGVALRSPVDPPPPASPVTPDTEDEHVVS